MAGSYVYSWIIIFNVISSTFSALGYIRSLGHKRRRLAGILLILLFVSWLTGIILLVYMQSDHSNNHLIENRPVIKKVPETQFQNVNQNILIPKSQENSKLDSNPILPCAENQIISTLLSEKKQPAPNNASKIAHLFKNCYPYQACPLDEVHNFDIPAFTYQAGDKSLNYQNLSSRDWKTFSYEPWLLKFKSIISTEQENPNHFTRLILQRESYKNFTWMPEWDVAACEARGKTNISQHQLQHVLGSIGDGPVVFTVVDISYVDMIDDVWQMAKRVHMAETFFFLSLDAESNSAACQAGYPVVHFGDLSVGNIRTRVYQAKYQVAVQLIDEGVSFLFVEMDVWISKNIIPIFEAEKSDLVVVLHQSRPHRINTGIIFVRACVKMKALFGAMLHFLIKNQRANEQDVFNCFVRPHSKVGFLKGFSTQCDIKFVAPSKDDPVVLSMRTVLDGEDGLRLGYIEPNTIAVRDSPLGVRDTVAVHIIADKSMKSIHGRKVLAKELNLWEGANCYHCVGGGRKKYIAYKGVLTNMIPPNWRKNEWLYAAILHLVMMAVVTDRILILPNIFLHEEFLYIWHLLDLESLRNVVEWREAGFLENARTTFDPDTTFAEALFSDQEIMVGKISLDGKIIDSDIFLNPMPLAEVTRDTIRKQPIREMIHDHRVNIWGTLVESRISSSDVIFVEFGHDFTMHEGACFTSSIVEPKEGAPLIKQTQCRKAGRLSDFVLAHLHDSLTWCNIHNAFKDIYEMRRLDVKMDCHSKRQNGQQ